MGGFNILIVVLMFATLGVLGVGVALMMRGGALNEKYSNRLMFMRVSLQAMVVLLLGLMFVVGR